jgi:hypothetical protein
MGGHTVVQVVKTKLIATTLPSTSWRKSTRWPS